MDSLIHTATPEVCSILSGQQHQSSGITRASRSRGTKDWLMVTTLRGEGYCRSEGRELTMVRGTIVLFAPGTPQDYGHLRDDGDWLNIWVHFHPRSHWMSWLNWPTFAKGVMTLQLDEGFDRIALELSRMVETGASSARLRHDAALNCLERALIFCDDHNPLNWTAGLDTRIRKSLDIINAQIAAPLTVEGLGRSVGLSRSRFSKLFSEQTMLSPQAYVEQVRLTRAAQLLRFSPWSIGVIADTVGFPNAYYFSTRFRRSYGVPPSVYRSRLGRIDTATATH